MAHGDVSAAVLVPTASTAQPVVPRRTADPRRSARNRRINTAVLVGVLSLVSVAVLWPVVHMVAAAFTPGQSISNMPVVPFSEGMTSEHFAFVFTSTQYPRWFANTFIIATATCIGTLLISSLGAYVFSRFTFAFKKP